MSANGEEDNSFAWDDTVLIKAYDNSLSLAREELARRIATSTNSRSRQSVKENDEELEGAVGGEVSSGTNGKAGDVNSKVYKVGDFVRATYDVDGIDYEAAIISISDNGETCILRYLGYDNEQEVRVSDLVPSWGKKVRRAQIAVVKGDVDNAGLGENVSVHGAERKKSIGLKKPKQNSTNRPGGSSNSILFDMRPPLPPVPPMFATSNHITEDSEHLSAMLMSWYMSGYYTGVYQGIQMSKNQQTEKKSK